MLELARCRECGEVKLCIPFRGVQRKDGVERCYVNYYCPECDEAIDEFIDLELERYREMHMALARVLGKTEK